MLVKAVEVVFPQVGAQPCSSGVGGSPRRVLARFGELPRIGHHVHHPSLSIVAVKYFRGVLSAFDRAFHQVDEGAVELMQIAGLHLPVVHLHVYVGVIIAVPWSPHFISPQPLQIGREGSRQSAAYQQVSAIVVIQSGERWIVLVAEFLDAPVGGETGYVALFKFYCRAVKQRIMVLLPLFLNLSDFPG